MNLLDELQKAYHCIDRVKALPEIDFQDIPKELPAAMTHLLSLPGGRQSLWPNQARTLEYAHEFQGLLANLPVGSGKTLISLLLPVVLNSPRPLLIVPASLLDKTHREFSQYRKEWKSVPMRTVSYESLGRISHSDFLEGFQPSVIIADEAHKLANYKTSACARRVDRWMRKHPETLFCALSGTMMKRSLTDFAHLARWALRDGSPLPLRNDEVLRWALATDPETKRQKRVPYSTLHKLCRPGESTAQAVGRRIVSAPGVVAVKDSFSDIHLTLKSTKCQMGPSSKSLLTKMRSTWETPNGDVLLTAVDLWRHAQEMSLGFYSFWTPSAPMEWMEARKDWQRFVRDTLGRKRTLDSPLQIQNAVENGELDCNVLQPWLDIKDRFTPNPIATWLDAEPPPLMYAAQWLKDNPKKGLVWVAHLAVGEYLEKKTGVPFFAGGQEEGRSVELHDGSAIVSIAANCTGRNLQRWNKNLVLTPPSAGRTWEQLIGRTHRFGQTETTVSIEVLIPSEESEKALTKAYEDATYIKSLFGQEQKLLMCKGE